MRTKLNLIHRRYGIAVVGVFLLTGVYMWAGFPELYGANEAIRFMFRANHIYILLAGLLNIGLGTYLSLSEQRWRRNLQVAGSFFILVAPAILVIAFFYDPPRANPDRLITKAGIVSLLVGTLCHLPYQRPIK